MSIQENLPFYSLNTTSNTMKEWNQTIYRSHVSISRDVKEKNGDSFYESLLFSLKDIVHDACLSSLHVTCNNPALIMPFCYCLYDSHGNLLDCIDEDELGDVNKDQQGKELSIFIRSYCPIPPHIVFTAKLNLYKNLLDIISNVKPPSSYLIERMARCEKMRILFPEEGSVSINEKIKEAKEAKRMEEEERKKNRPKLDNLEVYVGKFKTSDAVKIKEKKEEEEKEKEKGDDDIVYKYRSDGRYVARIKAMSDNEMNRMAREEALQKQQRKQQEREVLQKHMDSMVKPENDTEISLEDMRKLMAKK